MTSSYVHDIRRNVLYVTFIVCYVCFWLSLAHCVVLIPPPPFYDTGTEVKSTRALNKVNGLSKQVRNPRKAERQKLFKPRKTKDRRQNKRHLARGTVILLYSMLCTHSSISSALCDRYSVSEPKSVQ